MEKDKSKYEVILNSSIGIMRNFILLGFIAFFAIIFFNTIYNVNRVWNICFIFPVALLFISSTVLISLCSFKINSFDEKKAKLISNLLMSSYITFYTFLFSVLLYFILTIIFYN